MKAEISGYEIEIKTGDDTVGLPDRIIIRPEELENDYVWIYTLTKTTTYDKIPPRLVKDLKKK